ncbi:CCD97 protein, partial [Poecile atricapillus]|nr:CCD97 protein [Poecile atricapillus]
FSGPAPMADPSPEPSGGPREPRTGPDRSRGAPRGRPPARTRLRNRRFAALRELLREGDYFSEERMRLRAPRLFQHYIGRFREPQNPRNRPQILGNEPRIPW